MTFTDSQKSGVIATVLIHTVLLLFLFYMGLVLPYPPKQEEGFLVDFGNSDTGLGLEEPRRVAFVLQLLPEPPHDH